MKDLFSALFQENWHFDLVNNRKTSHLYSRVELVYKVLQILSINKGDTVALYGYNSFHWVAIYIACILRGVTLVVVPPRISQNEANHILTFSNAKLLFMDNHLVYPKLGEALTVMSIIDIELLRVIYDKTIAKEPSNTILVDMVHDSHNEEEILKYPWDTFKNNIDLYGAYSAKIATPTSGVSTGIPKWIVATWMEIQSMLSAANLALPFYADENVSCHVDFAESHYVTLLLPLMRGVHLITDRKQAHVAIEDTNSIEALWSDILVDLVNSRFKARLYALKPFAWIIEQVALNRLKRAFNRHLKALVIYNCDVSPYLIRLLRKRFNLYTTYGLQETCQLVAVNDYSTKELQKENAVGLLLKGVDAYTEKSELLIHSSHNCWRRLTVPKGRPANIELNTQDVGFINDRTGVLYVYGRAKAVRENEFGLPFQVDNLERTLRAIPYIKAVCHYSKDNNNALLIEPNIEFIEAQNLSYFKVKNILKTYLHAINKSLRTVYKIDRIMIVGELEKTFNNKIVRYYYTQILP